MAVEIGKGCSARALGRFNNVSNIQSARESVTMVSSDARMRTSPKVSLLGCWSVSRKDVNRQAKSLLPHTGWLKATRQWLLTRAHNVACCIRIQGSQCADSLNSDDEGAENENFTVSNNLELQIADTVSK